MGYNSVVLGYPKSIGIPWVDELTGYQRGPRVLGRHNLVSELR